jgi:hypothetical protein
MVQQAEAEAWVFRTTEVLEGGGSDAAQLRHGRQARKRLASDARDSRHISDAGGLMMKNSKKPKDDSAAAKKAAKLRSESESDSSDEEEEEEGEPAARAPRPEFPPLPKNAVPGLVARSVFREPEIPEFRVRCGCPL